MAVRELNHSLENKNHSEGMLPQIQGGFIFKEDETNLVSQK